MVSCGGLESFEKKESPTIPRELMDYLNVVEMKSSFVKRPLHRPETNKNATSHENVEKKILTEIL